MMPKVPEAAVSPSPAPKPKHGRHGINAVVIVRHYDWRRYGVWFHYGLRIRGYIAYAAAHENQTNDDNYRTKVISVHGMYQPPMLI